MLTFEHNVCTKCADLLLMFFDGVIDFLARDPNDRDLIDERADRLLRRFRENGVTTPEPLRSTTEMVEDLLQSSAARARHAQGVAWQSDGQMPPI